MKNIGEIVGEVSADEMDGVLKAIIHRYGELFPNCELHIISMNKLVDRNEQLDRIICAIQSMKI